MVALAAGLVVAVLDAKVVVDQLFHLSYPQVFESEGPYYMIPETGEASEFRLYKATDFPMKWAFVEKPTSPPSTLGYNDA